MCAVHTYGHTCPGLGICRHENTLPDGKNKQTGKEGITIGPEHLARGMPLPRRNFKTKEECQNGNSQEANSYPCWMEPR